MSKKAVGVVTSLEEKLFAKMLLTVNLILDGDSPAEKKAVRIRRCCKRHAKAIKAGDRKAYAELAAYLDKQVPKKRRR